MPKHNPQPRHQALPKHNQQPKPEALPKHSQQQQQQQQQFPSNLDHKPFTCDVCGRDFTRRSNLIAHMGTHETVRKRIECTVENCGALVIFTFYICILHIVICYLYHIAVWRSCFWCCKFLSIGVTISQSTFQRWDFS